MNNLQETLNAIVAATARAIRSNPAKLNPRCWNCGKPMSKTMREMTVFCSEDCEREYHHV